MSQEDIQMKIRQADVDMWAAHARIVIQATAAIADDLKQIILDYKNDPSTGADLYYQRIGYYIVSQYEEACNKIESNK